MKPLKKPLKNVTALLATMALSKHKRELNSILTDEQKKFIAKLEDFNMTKHLALKVKDTAKKNSVLKWVSKSGYSVACLIKGNKIMLSETQVYDEQKRLMDKNTPIRSSKGNHKLSLLRKEKEQIKRLFRPYLANPEKCFK